MLAFLLSIIVSAALDTSEIMIGDQTDLHLQAICEPTEQVAFPVFGEELIPGLEIVDRTIRDTTTLRDGRLRYDQYLTLTGFHDSLYYIEPIAFTSGNDTFWSEGERLSLNIIQPFEIDTTLAITDIKPIAKAPIWWWGIIRWILLALALAGLAVGGYFAWKKWGYLLSHNPQSTIHHPQPTRPCEEVALEKLDIIKAEKIWQAGEVKKYHTLITDVVREYIAGRFDFSSTEKTSDETLRAMKEKLSDNKDLYHQLRQMLSLADLVKFAKWQTTPEENERSLADAYTFVHETTEKEKVEEDQNSKL
ncbi:MAG: hypothetical protein MJZ84_04235 [Paludibacteraceae bacterium]|nr:hypothetical protein [Paludibacteraceae bacterium]